MKLFKNIFILFVGIIIFLPYFVKAEGYDIDDYRNAVVETALSYVNQGNQVQYDSYRKNFFATPEDATSQHIVYTVCSGFTFQAYYQALGIELPDTTEKLLAFAKFGYRNGEYSDYVLYYYDSDSENDITDVFSSDGLGVDEYNTNLVINWSKVVKPGDLIVYSGHVMLVEKIDGNNIRIAEAQRGNMKYDYVNHKDKYEEADSPTLKSNVSLNAKLKLRYGDADEDKIKELAVIRPIIKKNVNNYSYVQQTGSSSNFKYTVVDFVPDISEATKSRLKYQDIDIEKIAVIENSPNQQILVNVGEEITYQLTIKNNSSSDYSGFNVVEYIDSNVIVTQKGNGTLVDNELKWNNIILKAGEDIILTYKVKVPLDKKMFGKIIISTGKVDNISTSKIETYVGNKFTPDEKNKILNVDLNKITSFEAVFINDIYKSAFGIDLGLSSINNNLDIISYDKEITSSGNETLSVKRTKVNNVPVAKYIYNNFYGLRTFEGVTKEVNAERDCPNSSLVRITLHWNNYPTYELNDRARDLTKGMLDDGDIILLYTNDSETIVKDNKCPTEVLENRSYIYLDNKLIRKLEDGTFEHIEGDTLTTFLRDIVGDNYIVLKPSLAFGEGIDQFYPIYNVNVAWDNLSFDWVYDKQTKKFGWKPQSICEDIILSNAGEFDYFKNDNVILYSDNKCSSIIDDYVENTDVYYRKIDRKSAHITITDNSEKGQIIPSIKWSANTKYSDVDGTFEYLGNKCIEIKSKDVFDLALNYGIYSDTNCKSLAINNGFVSGKYYALAMANNVLAVEELPDDLRHSAEYGDEYVDGVYFGGYGLTGERNIYDLMFTLKNKDNVKRVPVKGENIGNITISFKAKE